MSMLARFATTGGAVATYIEDVFSTYLYTGNGSTQTITNGVDLAGKGGLVWIKRRVDANYDHVLCDSARGINNRIQSNQTAAQYADATLFNSFDATGFTLGDGSGSGLTNGNTKAHVSWTFRKQPKFFDVVTYTGNATSGRAIAHSLGSTPGCVIVKCTTNTYDWMVYHRSLPSSSYFLKLNTTGAQVNVSSIWSTTAPTATDFYVGSDGSTNGSGETYVAYIFAHDAGGFGQSGSDNVISCGSFDGAANTTVTLGYEPQWIMFKNTTSTSNWQIIDNMRGMPVGSDDKQLMANLSNAESDNGLTSITATGFTWLPAAAGNTYIYIAIRRGPMKTPTTGTSVYTGSTYTGNGTTNTITGLGFTPDMVLGTRRDQPDWGMFDRLRGASKCLVTSSTNAEAGTIYDLDKFDVQNGFGLFQNANASLNTNGQAEIAWSFRRAPGFFDVVCYTGTGGNRTVSHNLGVAPELMIVKERSGIRSWKVYAAPLGNTQTLTLDDIGAASGPSPTVWNSTTPSASVFSLGTAGEVNTSTATYVAYLFATVAGVSKVFSYTGNGSSQTINCGFTGGARFVLIKRTDSTGDWYVWDSARGIVAGNDPHMSLNSRAAEVTTDDSVDTDSTGFVVNQLAATNVNVNTATYIGLAIA